MGPMQQCSLGPLYPSTMFQKPVSKPSSQKSRKTIIIQKLLVTQSSIIVHCDLHTQKPICVKFQTFSNTGQKLLVRQTSNQHHCDQHAPKPLCKNFQVILSSSSWSKKLCVFLRNKYGSQIGNAMEKYKMLQTGSVIAPGVQIYKFEADWMCSFQDMSTIGIFLISLYLR